MNKFLYNLYLIFFNNRFLSRWTVLFIDMLLVLFSTIISYSVVQMVFQRLDVHFPEFKWILLVSLTANFLCFFFLKTYKGIIRYSTIYEIQRLIVSLVISHIFIFSLIYFVIDKFITDASGNVTLSYCLTSLAVTSFALVGLRLFIVFAYTKFSRYTNKKNSGINVFVFGISSESVSLKQSLSVSPNKFQVVGFISLDKTNRSKRISDIPIIYVDQDNLYELKKFSNRAVLFPSEDSLKNNSEFVEKLLNEDIKVYLLPHLKNVKNVEESIYKNIRPIQIEDLLGRAEIKISMDLIEETIKGKNILVTGAAGSIGSEIVRQLATFEPRLIICVDIAETPLNDLDIELKGKFPDLDFVSVIGDVRNTDRLEMIFSRYKPNIVYHAAAYKHVPMMENNPCEAILTNVYGTKQVADFSIKNNVEMFVMISTDKAVNPTNIMGASKRIAEIYIQDLALRDVIKSQKIKFVTTRFGNVLGSNGSVIPLFRQQIEHGGPLTVTHPDITRYFMTIPEACRLVLEASTIGKTGYIYVFDMGNPVKILDLAKKMIELAGLRPNIDIKIKFTGLRPGEKLYEELLNDSERVIPTDHEKILIAKVNPGCEDIDAKLDQLIIYSRKVDIPSTVVLMKEIVPEFISKNSRFSDLDKERTLNV